jgi:hypothetical protein
MDIRPGSTGCRTSLERVLLLYRDNCSGGSCAAAVVEEEVEEEEEASADEDDDVTTVKALSLLRSRRLVVAFAAFRGNGNRLRCRLSCLDVETQACASFDTLQKQRTTQTVKRVIMVFICWLW